MSDKAQGGRSGSVHRTGNVGLRSDIKIELNPISSLQELCMAHYYPFPVYTVTNENLKKMNESFTVMCSISSYNSSGTGMTKQAAKKEAAYLMYKQIKEFTSEDLHHVPDNKCEYKDTTSNNMLFSYYESVILLKTFIGSIGATNTSHLHNIEKNSYGFKYTAVDTLKLISEKENFTFNYVVISQNIDKVEVMIQMNKIPVVVVSGSGKNENDACESAARVVLMYFKSKLDI